MEVFSLPEGYYGGLLAEILVVGGAAITRREERADGLVCLIC